MSDLIPGLTSKETSDSTGLFTARGLATNQTREREESSTFQTFFQAYKGTQENNSPPEVELGFTPVEIDVDSSHALVGYTTLGKAYDMAIKELVEILKLLSPEAASSSKSGALSKVHEIAAELWGRSLSLRELLTLPGSNAKNEIQNLLGMGMAGVNILATERIPFGVYFDYDFIQKQLKSKYGIEIDDKLLILALYDEEFSLGYKLQAYMINQQYNLDVGEVFRNLNTSDKKLPISVLRNLFPNETSYTNFDITRVADLIKVSPEEIREITDKAERDPNTLKVLLDKKIRSKLVIKNAFLNDGSLDTVVDVPEEFIAQVLTLTAIEKYVEIDLDVKVGRKVTDGYVVKARHETDSLDLGAPTKQRTEVIQVQRDQELKKEGVADIGGVKNDKWQDVSKVEQKDVTVSVENKSRDFDADPEQVKNLRNRFIERNIKYPTQYLKLLKSTNALLEDEGEDTEPFNPIPDIRMVSSFYPELIKIMDEVFLVVDSEALDYETFEKYVISYLVNYHLTVNLGKLLNDALTPLPEFKEFAKVLTLPVPPGSEPEAVVALESNERFINKRRQSINKLKESLEKNKAGFAIALTEEDTKEATRKYDVALKISERLQVVSSLRSLDSQKPIRAISIPDAQPTTRKYCEKNRDLLCMVLSEYNLPQAILERINGIFNSADEQSFNNLVTELKTYILKSVIELRFDLEIESASAKYSQEEKDLINKINKALVEYTETGNLLAILDLNIENIKEIEQIIIAKAVTEEQSNDRRLFVTAVYNKPSVMKILAPGAEADFGGSMLPTLGQEDFLRLANVIARVADAEYHQLRRTRSTQKLEGVKNSLTDIPDSELLMQAIEHSKEYIFTFVSSLKRNLEDEYIRHNFATEGLLGLGQEMASDIKRNSYGDDPAFVTVDLIKELELDEVGMAVKPEWDNATNTFINENAFAKSIFSKGLETGQVTKTDVAEQLAEEIKLLEQNAIALVNSRKDFKDNGVVITSLKNDINDSEEVQRAKRIANSIFATQTVKVHASADQVHEILPQLNIILEEEVLAEQKLNLLLAKIGLTRETIIKNTPQDSPEVIMDEVLREYKISTLEIQLDDTEEVIENKNKAREMYEYLLAETAANSIEREGLMMLLRAVFRENLVTEVTLELNQPTGIRTGSQKKTTTGSLGKKRNKDKTIELDEPLLIRPTTRLDLLYYMLGVTECPNRSSDTIANIVLEAARFISASKITKVKESFAKTNRINLLYPRLTADLYPETEYTSTSKEVSDEEKVRMAKLAEDIRRFKANNLSQMFKRFERSRDQILIGNAETREILTLILYADHLLQIDRKLEKERLLIQKDGIGALFTAPQGIQNVTGSGKLEISGHPNYFILMDYINGYSLNNFNGTVPELFILLDQLCYSLRHSIHDQGINHGDIKPQNALVEETPVLEYKKVMVYDPYKSRWVYTDQREWVDTGQRNYGAYWNDFGSYVYLPKPGSNEVCSLPLTTTPGYTPANVIRLGYQFKLWELNGLDGKVLTEDEYKQIAAFYQDYKYDEGADWYSFYKTVYAMLIKLETGIDVHSGNTVSGSILNDIYNEVVALSGGSVEALTADELANSIIAAITERDRTGLGLRRLVDDLATKIKEIQQRSDYKGNGVVEKDTFMQAVVECLSENVTSNDVVLAGLLWKLWHTVVDPNKKAEILAAPKTDIPDGLDFLRKQLPYVPDNMPLNALYAIIFALDGGYTTESVDRSGKRQFYPEQFMKDIKDAYDKFEQNPRLYPK